MISKEALEEFKVIYKKEYNEDISDEKALDLATNLLNIMNVVYRPIKKEWVGELEEKENRNKAGDKPVFHK
ncbi:MAG: hypothetical protein Q8R55_08100 [Candidatus Taylorbacteria bacterium]|nr:hypothetical protein [Candidatus Taylorbacteria bacterium]